MTRLYRSERDKKVFGICGGLGEAWNVDSNLLRLVVIVTAFFSAGTVILLYLLAALVIPKESDLARKEQAAYAPYGTNPPFYGSYPPPHDGHHPGAAGSFGAGPHGAGGPYSAAGAYGAAGRHAAGTHGAQETPRAGQPNLDELMKDVEKKALLKEIEELKARLAKYEKGDVS